MNKFLETLQAKSLSWLSDHGLAVAGIIIGAWIVAKFGTIFIEKVIRKTVRGDKFSSKEAEEKREATLIKIIDSTIKVLVWIFAIMMMLSEVGIEIGPLLAAAGVAGLALGFGGQYLIKDVITGLFIILENQYRVGDAVCFGDTCGTVEDISLRKTTLRDMDGTVHHIPHGSITLVANRSKDFARINLNIGIAYDADIDHVMDVVNKVGNVLAEDAEWKEKITKAPQFLRVNSFDDSAVTIKILGEAKPLTQWEVMGELRKRLKIAFDKEGIEIPFPQRVIHEAKK